ncbi:hypothetical protein JCM3775_001054 [Rhodotorula graminis]|uniref:Uncharacterized protein n=1 Tax=Rhodotorula graminis (strain WP1) TaxID=578459 RepID=A0A194SCU9_RHOGW|nr:uncharacterized protein RHOBADRAFT_40985 [Rhodotorula graminis WP1]KPV78439.1 hypothetical protein RHOBADRAFT_40985 [Rhodotorula graminis WP1]
MEYLRKLDSLLKVEQEAGWKGKGAERWSNKDLDPVPREKRTWGMLSIISYWTSDQFSPASWSLGASLIAMGMTAREAIPITFVGFTLCGIIIAVNGKIGSLMHVSFPVLARASLGPWGSFPAIIVRCILSLLWLAIQTYLAGSMMAQLLGAIWPSYLRIENTLPIDLGLTTQQLGGFLLYWAIQTPVSCIPVHKMRHLFLVKAVLCPVGYSAICFWALAATKGDAPSLNGTFDGSLTAHGKAAAVFSGLNAIGGLYSTVQLNIPDFSRFSHSSKSIWWQIIIVPVTGTWPVACGVIATAAAQQLYGVEAWDAATLVSLWGHDSASRAARFFAAAMFLFSTLGVNISANSISFATDLTALLPRYLTILRSSIIAGILAIAINPWKVVNGSASFYNFLQSYSVILGPLACIIATDFYLVRKGRIDVRDLYDPAGPYKYTLGVHWRGYAAWIGALAPNLPGLAHAITPSLPNKGWEVYTFGWGVGCVLGVVLYYGICLVSPPTSSFVPEAVYEIDDDLLAPASRGDIATSDGDTDLEKKQSGTGEVVAVV